jgi:hypothetical protein
MAKKNVQALSSHDQIADLTQKNFLFRGLDPQELAHILSIESSGKEGSGKANASLEKLYSSRPIYTAYLPDVSIEHLYVVVAGGPVIVRSAPLDRIIEITYAGGCFGMPDLSFGNRGDRGFPSLVESYKTTDALKIPAFVIQKLYESDRAFQERYNLLFELREKFQYHLLNCSTYPPQAVAALLRALIYQERTLGNQPQFPKSKPSRNNSELNEGIFCFDLPIDLIARACQLNHRTVEQVLKGMTKVGLLKENAKSDVADLVQVRDPEGMKAVYGATRDKVDWWPLR